MNKNKTIELKEVVELINQPGHFASVDDGIILYNGKIVTYKGKIVSKEDFDDLVELIPAGLGKMFELKKPEITTMVDFCTQTTHEDCLHSDKEIKPGKVTFGNELG